VLITDNTPCGSISDSLEFVDIWNTGDIGFTFAGSGNYDIPVDIFLFADSTLIADTTVKIGVNNFDSFYINNLCNNVPNCSRLWLSAMSDFFEYNRNGEVCIWEFDITKVDRYENLPNSISMSSPFPNPANNEINIILSTNIISKCTVNLFNIQGVLIKTILTRTLSPGENLIKITGDGFPSGIYFIEASNGHSRAVRKLAFID
jgi:hypothetical protein